jgi:DNA-binding NarL/FixJ family response regulator
MSIAFPLRTVTHRAVVAGVDPRRRSQVIRLLGAAGFDVTGTVAPGAVIVLVAAESEVERGREVRELADAHPDVGVLAVVPADTPNASLRRALIAGAAGIVLTSELESTLVPSVHAVQAGQLVVPSSLSRAIAPRPLSHREKQILGLVVQGLTNREIAERLYLAESTIKTHLSSIFRKIDARSRAEAVTRIQDPDSGYGPVILAPAADMAAPAA